MTAYVPARLADATRRVRGWAIAARWATHLPAAHSVTPGKTSQPHGSSDQTPAPTANGVPCATSHMSEPTRIAVSEADSPAAKIQTSRVSTTVMTSPVNAAHSPAATPAIGAGSGPERQNEVTALVGEAQPARVALILSASRPPALRLTGRDRVVRPLLAGPCDARLTGLGSHPFRVYRGHTRRFITVRRAAPR
jgi:hypothetical protein